MATVLEYRGRRVTDGDVAFIRELIASRPEASRRALSRELCEAWGFVQANGSHPLEEAAAVPYAGLEAAQDGWREVALTEERVDPIQR
jgi:hypothetical protein